MRKISLIIPAYNAEDTIQDALFSAINQTYPALKIIVVNDGSTDNTLTRTKEVIAQYSDVPVQIIDQKNQGALASRLHGVQAATDSELIAFMDADDMVSPRFIEHMEMDLEEADVVAEGAIRVNRQVRKQELNAFAPGVYATEAEQNEFYQKMLCWNIKDQFHFGILPYLCNKLFKRTLILHELERADLRVGDGDDVSVLYAYLLHSTSIRVGTYCDYYYQNISGSLSHTCSKEAYLNTTFLYQKLYSDFSNDPRADALLPQLDQYYRMMVYKENPPKYLLESCFVFPYGKIPRHTRLVLYGGGNMGKAFWEEIRRNRYCHIVAWLDKRPVAYQDAEQSVQQKYPAEIDQCEYDQVLIAITDDHITNEVFEDLLSFGVPEVKIVTCEEYHFKER